MNGPLEPQAIRWIDGSRTRICRAASVAFIPYSRAGMCPICHGPSISLPTHQYFTLCGCSYPCERRRLLHLVPPATLQYSTRAAASSADPVPKLSPNNGSVPTWRAHVMNFLHHVGAESIAVSELRLGIVDAFVDRASQVLQKRAKENGAYWRNLPAGIDNYARRARSALS